MRYFVRVNLDERSRHSEHWTFAEKALGTDHAFIGYLLNTLDTRNGRKAMILGEASLKSALAINEKALVREHPQTVQSLSRLGQLYESEK